MGRTIIDRITIHCSELVIVTQEQGVKYVQS